MKIPLMCVVSIPHIYQVLHFEDSIQFLADPGSCALCSYLKSGIAGSNVDDGVDVRLLREERENQQDSTIRCLLSSSVSTCFGHHYAHLRENKDRVLLHMVYCVGSAGCGW
jgi:hypothetical protein